jgi:heme exporter protein C
MRRGEILLGTLWALCTVAICTSLWMVFSWVREERTMGAVQKLFYFHLPAMFATYAAIAVLLGGSLAYLRTRSLRWDNLSRAATEIGALFCGLVLLTGSIWARPAWGTWWTWEARLTTTLLLWLLLLGGLMVRGYADDRDTGARLASILGIVAALDLPIIIMAVTWWRGQHPDNPEIASDMKATLGVSTLAVLLLFGLLLALRYRAAQLADRAAAAADRLARTAEAEA